MPGRLCCHIIKLREIEELVDQLLQPLRLLSDNMYGPSQVTLRVDAVLYGLGIAPDDHHWGFQLMGDMLEHRLLVFILPLQTIAHYFNGGGQLADFVFALQCERLTPAAAGNPPHKSAEHNQRPG
ncbi:hypothetical protein D3C87_1788800 [compost metagenome]